MTSTFKPEADLLVRAALQEKDLAGALRKAAEVACRLFGLPKIYFAQAIGRRLHHLTYYGEETYLPAVKEPLGHNLYVFLEGAEQLDEEKKTVLLAALREVVELYADKGREAL
ncbi:hypothetical protein Adeg_1242 [Ammonifex degensii KC4]|uniref:Uncharacterized protein n=1 Tax=Ammonifex degensii (strain DSM 10501 / KC4) TaxID=429009 RepID=C9R7S4_AMMDK|nr:hypothetical protein [Ammonifex degensii]ACX52353.1 hypothetical protein Adeg_1242 [Ammonifex degensii KC4]